VTVLFEKVLIATDGSERNQAAVQEGLRIARACGSAVYAVYVIDEASLTSAQQDVLTADVYGELREEGERALGNLRQGAGGIRLETFLLSGRPAQVITGFARERGIDLIVVGSQGKTGLERLLLGSVAESIIRLAECMVLVVKG